jgi:hypothetical protein
MWDLSFNVYDVSRLLKTQAGVYLTEFRFKKTLNNENNLHWRSSTSSRKLTITLYLKLIIQVSNQYCMCKREMIFNTMDLKRYTVLNSLLELSHVPPSASALLFYYQNYGMKYKT